MTKQRALDIFYIFSDIYICLYFVYFSFSYVVPVRNFLGNTVDYLYYVVVAMGVALLGALVFLQPKSFFSKKNIFLTLFVAAMALSTLVNYKYELVSNIKELCWSCIMFFIIYAVDPLRSKENLKRLFKFVTNIFVIIWSVCVIVSVLQFVIGYGDKIPTPYSEVKMKRVGFTEGRLYGVFADPNFAAMGAFYAAVMSLLYITEKDTAKVAKIFYYIFVVFDIVYIILSGSRTAALSAAVAMCFLFYFVVRRLNFTQKHKAAVREIISVSAALVVSAAILFSGSLARDGLAYVPALFERVETEQNVDKNTGNVTRVHFDNNDIEQEDKDPVEDTTTKDGHISAADMHRPDVGTGNISNNRFKIWKDAIDIWKTTPIVGASPRGYLEYTLDKIGELYIAQKGYVLHNAYLSVLCFSGIVGALIILVWCVRIVYEVLKFLFAKKDYPEQDYRRVLLLLTIIVSVAVSSMLLSQVFFSHNVVDAVFWFILGYTLYYIDLVKNEIKA